MRGAATPPAPDAERRSARREAVILTLLLIGYSNGLAVLEARRGGVAENAFRLTNPLFLPLLLLAVASARRMPVTALLHEVGFQREGWPASLAGGLAVGLGLAGPPLLFFARPLVLDSPLEYGPIGTLTPGAFRRRLFVELPLGGALFEEVLFRGLLFDAWARAGSPRTAYLASSAAFAAWHFAVSVDTMQRTNIGAAVAPLPAFLRPHAHRIGVLGGMLSTGVAGLLFSLVRRWGQGNIAGPALAHWLVDALMIAALYRRGRLNMQNTEED
jgi:membrane protease YdiL (CAAX protease family)